METARMWLWLTVLSLAGAVGAQAQDSGATEKAVLARENQWLQSYRTNNPDLIAPQLADKFGYTAADGKVTAKAIFLSDTKKTKFSGADYKGVKVTVFGDTAIATGGFKGKGTDESGKPFDEHSRWTDTWVKMPNGRWQCVASQDTPIIM